MAFLSSLPAGDLDRYSRLIEEAICVRRHFDLLKWLQGDVQHFLPHEIMVAAWGDFNLGLVHHDIVSALPGVRTEHSSSEALSPLLRRLFDRWIEWGKKPYAIGAGESGFLLEDSGLQCALGGALQTMRSSLVHGISDERGRHDCLYVIFSSKEELGDSTRTAMSMLLPYLDVALRQVAHLPLQHYGEVLSEDPSIPAPTQPAEPPSKSGEEHGLSEREIEIMDWVRKGKTNQEVGSILDISSFTVKNHLQRIFKKLDAYNRTQAVAKFDRSPTHGRS